MPPVRLKLRTRTDVVGIWGSGSRPNTGYLGHEIDTAKENSSCTIRIIRPQSRMRYSGGASPTLKKLIPESYRVGGIIFYFTVVHHRQTEEGYCVRWVRILRLLSLGGRSAGWLAGGSFESQVAIEYNWPTLGGSSTVP